MPGTPWKNVGKGSWGAFFLTVHVHAPSQGHEVWQAGMNHTGLALHCFKI